MARLRYLTAGESHGPALTTICEGLPAGLEVSRDVLARDLARRRLGYGRSPRMDFEVDRTEVLGGVRFGRTLGSPVAVVIHNTEWPKWVDAMDPEPRDDLDEVRATGRGKRLTRPRPGHADLVAMLKYGYDDVRDALERASARETAARVVVGTLAKQLLAEVGIGVLSHVVQIGDEAVDEAIAPQPGLDDLDRIDADPVRCADPEASIRMQARIDRAGEQRETLGGIVEVVVTGAPPGLGSHVHWDRKLDARLAAAMLSVQAMKAVGFGEGFALGTVPGSRAHDEILPFVASPDDDVPDDDVPDGAATSGSTGRYRRTTARAGGIEAGMSTGQPITVRVAMKPLSSLPRPLRTVDTDDNSAQVAITQRSDACAVPRAGVVLEAVAAIELAEALLEKTGGDTVAEVVRSLDAYRADVAGR